MATSDSVDAHTATYQPDPALSLRKLTVRRRYEIVVILPSDAGQAFLVGSARPSLSMFIQLGAPLAMLDPKLWRGRGYAKALHELAASSDQRGVRE